MALFARLRQRFSRRATLPTLGSRRVSPGSRPGDAPHEDALRAELQRDPNNIEAFDALVAMIRRHTAGMDADADPLHAPAEDQDLKKEQADAATWAAAEEFAGHTRAWYPLIELARLSLDDDLEAATRRLATAADRDLTGRALAAGIALLRGADLPVDALGLGVGHWRGTAHVPEVGRQLVLAALDADRIFDARRYCDALHAHPDAQAAAAVLAEVEPLVEAAEQRTAASNS